ncbi:hypothetical protein ACLB2K_058842 [Fragaria x ananassa]
MSTRKISRVKNNFSGELPEDIMLLILRRLYLSDYFRCRAVSRSWLATIDRAIASKTSLPSPQFPCLMFSSGAEEEDHCCLSLSENHKVYKYSSPAYVMKNLECVGSTEGWLIMVDHGDSDDASHMSLYVFNINLDYAVNEDCHRHTYEAQRLVFVLYPDHRSGIRPVMTKEQDGVYELTESSPPSSSEDLRDWVLCIYNFVVPPPPIVYPPTAVFQVYKLENSNVPRWVEVFDIGNRILFLSKTTRLFIPIITIQDGDLPHDKAKLGGNCIYFAFGRSKRKGEDVGVFSLTDNSNKHYYTISGDRSPSRRAPPAWFTLNI